MTTRHIITLGDNVYIVWPASPPKRIICLSDELHDLISAFNQHYQLYSQLLGVVAIFVS